MPEREYLSLMGGEMWIERASPWIAAEGDRVMPAAPVCPKQPAHGPMTPRPVATQTAEQRWCGTWWDCETCRSAVLEPSPEVAASHRQEAA